MSLTIRGTLACLCLALASPARAQIPVYDRAGVEQPRFVAGNLTGQDPLLGPWMQSVSGGPVSTATVQSTTVQAGLQAVQVNRAANSEGFWFVPKSVITPQQVAISWDMRVTQSTGPQQ